MHLLHPPAVHFAVALLLAGVAAETWGMARNRPALERWGAASVLVGTGFLVLAAATGMLAANVVEVPPAAEPVVARHEQAGLLALACFLVSQFWKAWRRGVLPDSERPGYQVVVWAGAALVAYGAWLGGRLVFRYGVGVGS